MNIKNNINIKRDRKNIVMFTLKDYLNYLGMMAKVILENSTSEEQIEKIIKKLRKGDNSILTVVDALIEERKKHINIIENMLEEGLPISLISKITKLDEKEIEKINTNNK